MKTNIKYRRYNGQYGKYEGLPMFWGYLVLTICFLAVIMYLFKKPLISPIVENPVTLVHANEIKKEDTKSWKIYQLIRFYESNNGTQGLAVTCKKQGKINEVGYLPYKGFCFDNESDQESTVISHIQKEINYKGYTVNQILCGWNTGRHVELCAYAIGNLSEAN